MKLRISWWPLLVLAALSLLLLRGAALVNNDEQLARHRNLGKAYYENPTTQLLAVEEFKKSLELSDAVRDRVNFGLALLRAGRVAEAVAELEKVQQQDPSIPHTWFNLGIVFKKDARHERAIEQFERMVALVPSEPISHYNLGVLYKLKGQTDKALEQFKLASQLDPNLAGPHFQLYNAYRQSGQTDEAAREEKVFHDIKQRQRGAAIPEDLEWSVFGEIYETVEPRPAWESPRTPLQFGDENLGSGVDAASAGIAQGEFNGDARPDFVVWSASGIRTITNSATGAMRSLVWEPIGAIRSVAPGDFDNDGLQDLCILTDAGAVLYANGKEGFRKLEIVLPAGLFRRAVWLDYDRDYDLDLFLLGDRCALMRNNGQNEFSDRTVDFPFAAGRALDAAVFDLVMDTNGIDLVVSYEDHPGVLYRDRLAGRYEALPMEALPAGSRDLAGYDVDNNGWTDLVARTADGPSLLVNRTGQLDRLPLGTDAGTVLVADFENRGAADLLVGRALRPNLGLARFGPPSLPAGLPEIVAATASDFDVDGALDLAAVSATGEVWFFKNKTTLANQWLRIGLQGVRNLKLAPGAEIEVKAAGVYQKKTYRGQPLVFGLQDRKNLETVRITWPNGLIQNELRQVSGKSVVFKEAQRLSGSCPMIFTWNGIGFEFITDVLGVAPLGASSGEGQYFPVDNDEVIQIPGEALAAVDGQLEVRVTEELREVAYIDQIALIAVDHPAELQIFTNDKFKAPPFPEFRLFGVRRKIYPAGARSHRGGDVRPRLLRRDRLYVDDFRRDTTGVAEMHALELDFAGAADSNRAILILNGWVDWADGSTFRGAAQRADGGLVMPYLQVRDRAGRWQTVVADLGMPAGKPKSIVVDLTGKFLSESRQIRIVTNLCLYWDEIFLSEDAAAPTVRLSRLAAGTADLGFHGFSQAVIHPQRLQPERFDYERPAQTLQWNPTPGLYTRYGDARNLLELVDDRFVIMGSGDELRLRFAATHLPALPAGWKRDYLLAVDGWAKDGDPNTADSQTVEPLPFHGMTRYPYGDSERYPADESHQLYREQYNVRPALRLLRTLHSSGQWPVAR
ncbi:MAG: FG-GAP-like repeat-containing protein [Acidobacteriota bacterium]